MSSLPAKRQRAYLLLFINSFLWGISAPIIKYGLRYTSSEVFLFYRFIIASVLFYPFFRHHQKSNSKKPNGSPLTSIILGLLGGPLTLLPLFYGLTMTTSVDASILDATSPIFIVLLGLVFLKEKLTPKEIKGFIITLIGTAILSISPLINNSYSGSAPSFQGNLLIVFSSVIWAAFLYFSKKSKADTTNISFYSYLLSVPFFLFLIFAEGGSFAVNPSAVPSILFMGVAGSVISFWAYIEAQKLIEISEAAIFSYLRPVFALPLGLLWLNEPMSPMSVVSLIIIAIGVFFSESPSKK